MNTEKVKNISKIFFECSSISFLPDISKWNTQNITNMSYMFWNCSSISSLPDISNWNTENVITMSNMFSYCLSLQSLPDISKWNTQEVIDMNNMFSNCKSLTSLPDISSKWNTQNVTNMNSMFSECKSLKSKPDISKWNSQNVTDMNNMFNNCTSFSSSDKISKKKSLHEDSDIDCLPCKVVLLGEAGVGKTCIIGRFINSRFDDDIKSTTVASYTGKTMTFHECKGRSIKFEVWDTVGQEKYRALTKIFYKEAKVTILVYDITKKKSFEELKNYWYLQVKEYAPKDISKINYLIIFSFYF